MGKASRRPSRNDAYVTSGYGINTRRPFVSLKLRDVAVMISPTEARGLGLSLIEAAEAAEMDAVVVRWAVDGIGVTLPQAAEMLGDFRRLRDRLQVEEGEQGLRNDEHA